jgi:hypothetical protein
MPTFRLEDEEGRWLTDMRLTVFVKTAQQVRYQVVPTGARSRANRDCDSESRPEALTMKTLLLMVTVTATALMLAATSLAVGDRKNESPFTRSVKVVRIHTNGNLFSCKYGARCL